MSMLVSVYAFFPAALLNLLGQHERHQPFHRLVLSLLFLLLLVEVNLGVRTRPSSSSEGASDAFEVFCHMDMASLYR